MEKICIQIFFFSDGFRFNSKPGNTSTEANSVSYLISDEGDQLCSCILFVETVLIVFTEIILTKLF